MTDAKITIAAVGDVMPGGLFSHDLARYLPAFLPDEIARWLDADITFANCECPVSNDGPPIENKILLYARPESFGAFTALGVDVVSIATNHMMDYGYGSARATREKLDEMHIRHAGCGQDLAEARRPAVLDVSGQNVTFHCYAWTHELSQPSPGATDVSPGTAPLNVDHIAQDIRKAKGELGASLAVVSLHWGEGKSYYPRPSQVKGARAIIDAGADLVVGHHTHCLQGHEIYRDRPIFYSLGDFFSSPYMKDERQRLNYENRGKLRFRERRGRETIAVKVTFDGGRFAGVDFLPVVQDEHEPLLHVPPPELSTRIARRFRKISQPLSRPHYPLAFQILRRWTELGRIVEDFKEGGVTREHLSPRTLWRIIKKLVTGRSFH